MRIEGSGPVGAAPAKLLGDLDGDEPVRGFIMEQVCEIGEKAGSTPLAIKEISRVGAKKK